MKRTAMMLMLIVAATVPGFGQDTSSATVTVYRPKRTYGKMIKPSIYCDGVELTRLHNGTFFAVSLPSGKHMITSGRSEVGQFVNLEPGKQYYLLFGWQRWVTGFVGVQPVTLSLVSEDEARPEMQKLKEARK
jgi:hypothetical protein